MSKGSIGRITTRSAAKNLPSSEECLRNAEARSSPWNNRKTLTQEAHGAAQEDPHRTSPLDQPVYISDEDEDEDDQDEEDEDELPPPPAIPKKSYADDDHDDDDDDVEDHLPLLLTNNLKRSFQSDEQSVEEEMSGSSGHNSTEEEDDPMPGSKMDEWVPQYASINVDRMQCLDLFCSPGWIRSSKGHSLSSENRARFSTPQER